MGKRKTRKAPPKKLQPKMETTFDCPFCNHEKSVEPKMDRKKSIGHVRCRICGADYQTRINYLTDPIDVYSEWIDECERVNKKNKEADQDQDGDGDQYDEYDEDQPQNEDSDEEQVQYA